MKTIATLIIVIIISSFLHGQATVTFGYDAAGNRTSRTIDFGEKLPDSVLKIQDSLFVKATETNEDVPAKYQAKLGGQTIKIFPNPTSGLFAIEIEGWDNKTEAVVQLTSLAGKSLIEKRLRSAVTKFNIQGQPKGTYVLNVVLDGKKETWKIVKK